MPENNPRRRRLRDRIAAVTAATVALLGTGVVLAPAASAAVDDISITGPATADEGDTITVTVPVESATDLYAYDLTVTFDAALLNYDAGSAVFPAGGHDTVLEGTGTVTFAHTRLGSSPGLEGAQTLVTFTMTVLGGGSTGVTLDGASFVDSADASTTLEGTPTAELELIAAPTPTPTPTPTTSASPVATGEPTPAPAGTALPSTGGDITPFLVAGAFAVALVAFGAVLMIRRKKETVR